MSSPPPPPVSPAAMYLDQLAEGSKDTMRVALVNVVGLLDSSCEVDDYPWHELRHEGTLRLRSMLVQRIECEEISIASANKHLSAVRQVLKAAWRMDLLSTDDYHHATDVPEVKGETLPAGRSFSPAELAGLFRVCAHDERLAGARDTALFAVLYNAGLRRSECTALGVGDYELAIGKITVHKAKGRKEREVFLSTHGSRAALEDWLCVRGSWEGPLFVAINKGGKLSKRAMTGASVRWIVEQRALQAGIEHLTPHDFRRTMIGDSLDAGADIVTVQQIVGHADPATTARYDRRDERAKAAAAELLHVPYVSSD